MISGYFTPYMPQPFIAVAVQVPSVRPEWVLIPFVIDTGAAITCIHAVDAIRHLGMTPAGLDPTTWASTSPIGGIGGGLNYLELPANYGFQRDDVAWETFSETIRIGELRSQGTPALLGWDFLRYFELRVHGGSQTVTLERL